jgi:tRNA G18 (ribose-2'-O)-methylase SpoU
VGLSKNYRAICQEVVYIPMVGTASSLNVANAASILLYEAVRQRREKR